MTATRLIVRGLTYHWRTNLAMALGVGAAVAALAGALLVGASVRASLRDLVLARLGNTGQVVSASHFFREQLAQDLRVTASPLIAFEGVVVHEESGRRATRAQIYGVDERFWKFHGRDVQTPAAGEILLSEALARELSAKKSDAIQIRVERPSAVPAESLHGRKEDPGRTIRLTLRETLTALNLGEFSLRPQQGEVLAAFVNLRRLQRDLGQPGKANVILTSGDGLNPQVLRQRYSLEDLGVHLRPLDPERGFAVESDSILLSDTLADAALAAARALNARATPIFTYLANTIRIGQREVPYSLVAAMNAEGLALNDWTARELGAKVGDTVELDYYVWHPDGRLSTESARFPLARVIPIAGLGADRDLAPKYPGISDTSHLSDWDPPFPIDLKRVRPSDEKYWDQYRATPKVFLPLAEGQRLWGSRFGKLTSIRIGGGSVEAYGEKLRSLLDPLRAGFFLENARARGLEASRGATDFGEYFTYFSFFLVLAALMLAGLFFRFGVEQRVREIGMLRAVGLPPAKIRTLLLGEGLLVAALGSAAGIAASLAYGAVIVYGLRTWWVDAVGTRMLALDWSPAPLLLGAVGGLVMAPLFILGALRGLRMASPRSLLKGESDVPAARASGPRGSALIGILCAALALGLLGITAGGVMGQAGGFFGAGALLLTAWIFLARAWLVRRRARPVRDVARLGFRYAAYRPGRSVLSMALIASATFVIVSVDAFRRGAPAEPLPYPLLAESSLPIYYDPNTAAGQESLLLPAEALRGVNFVPFRLRAGEDASCLNLYQPNNPRVLAAPGAFLRQQGEPWAQLGKPQPDGAIAALADANSLTYVLHRKVGDVIEVGAETGRPVRLRVVGTLSDSIFQSELIVGDADFLRAFPEEQGYRFFLIGAPAGRIDGVTKALEQSLADFGFDVTSAAERLATFHRVENTYISTFQTLGGLGLLLGTAGLAAILLRNVFERRREIALLRATGYRSADLGRMILAENTLLLLAGLTGGTVSALVAVVPAWTARGGNLPVASLSILLGAVMLTGLIASLLALRAVVRSPLLEALRSE